MYRYIWMFLLVGSLPLFGFHSLDEGKKMIEGDWVQLNRLIIKLKKADSLSKESVHRALLKSSINSKTTYHLEPLFSVGKESSVDRAGSQKFAIGDTSMKLRSYYIMKFNNLTKVEALSILRIIYELTQVEFAYFEPQTEYAGWVVKRRKKLRTSAPTPDFESKQFHLDEAPRGVGARSAWKLDGGDGSGVRVIDIENGWNIKHEEFKAPFFKSEGVSSGDHGTAVWGEVAAKRDDLGVIGISYGVEFGVVKSSVPARGYEVAGTQLRSGDILIIEQHQRGPDNGNWTAMEYWQANFDAIKSLTDRGILVIAAAGNGGSNFDNSVYQGAFDLNQRDSGGILVGAGAPPTSSQHLSRLSFSNYGSRIDAFGYGSSVVTTGYGSLFNGGENRTYTSSFSGTSSATPIVSGAVASVLGILKKRGEGATPKQMRQALRDTGTEQKGDTQKRIGNLPEISTLLDYLSEKRGAGFVG